MRRLMGQITYANVVSTLALLLAVSGTTAYAAGKIKTRQIKPGAIKTKLLARKAVKSGKIAPRAVRARHIVAGAVHTRHIAPGTVGSEQLMERAVGRDQLAPSSVGRDQLAPHSVGSDQLAPNSVDGSKVRDGSLTPADLLGGASVVTTASGGPTPIDSTDPNDPDPVPLERGAFTQAPGQNLLFLLRAEATLAKVAESHCSVMVGIEVDGDETASLALSAGTTEPATVVGEQLLGARIATGQAQQRQLGVNVHRSAMSNCTASTLDSVEIAVLGVG